MQIRLLQLEPAESFQQNSILFLFYSSFALYRVFELIFYFHTSSGPLLGILTEEMLRFLFGMVTLLLYALSFEKVIL